MKETKSLTHSPTGEVPKSTKEKLFETAIDLFSSQGFKGVSIRDLTSAIGIKESSFYNHYKSKDDLIEAIFSYYKTAFAQTMPPEGRIEAILATVSPPEFLRQGNLRFMERMSGPQIQKIWRILFTEQYRDKRAREIIFHEMVQLPIAYTAKVFETMIKMDLIKAYDPALLAAEYQYPVAFMFSIFLMAVSEQADLETLKKQLSDHVDFFWKIIQK
jgi:AcrR family transcriptional regulator